MGEFRALVDAMMPRLDLPDLLMEVAARTGFPELLSCLDPALLQGSVITADAMHSQREAAQFLHKRGAHYLFYAAGNQPGLFAAINALDWEHTPIAHTTHESRRGRREKRTFQVLPAPEDLRFPHAEQVFLIERYTYDGQESMVRACAALGVTSMGPEIADGRRILAYNRGNGRSRIHCTECVMSSTGRTLTGCVRATPRRSWPVFAISGSVRCAWLGAKGSPQRPDATSVARNGRCRPSESRTEPDITRL